MRLIFAFLILIFIGCDKRSEVKEVGGVTLIYPDDSGVEEIRVKPWNVGPLYNQKISMGIIIKIAFPLIPDDVLLRMIKEQGIDSWLIKVKKRGSGSIDNIEYFYVPLIKESFSKANALRINQKKHGFIHVYYAAAAISSRFRKFKCPAFDHSYTISRVRENHRQSPRRTLRVRKSSSERFNNKASKFMLDGNIVNGGNSLIGEYIIDIAFYSSRKNRLFSNFISMPKTVEVMAEKTRTVKGCAGFEVPPRREDSGDPVKKFKFGR